MRCARKLEAEGYVQTYSNLPILGHILPEYHGIV
jgi:hypothetical protein